MSAPSHELAIYLDAQGVGTLGGTTGWRLQANLEPSTPDQVITLYDTGGSAPRLYDDELRQPTIQVRVRGNNYADAYAKQEEVFDILNAIINQDIEDHFYVGVWMQTDIIQIGPDDNNRPRLTANYSIEREPS